jgi:hypothetical protein
MVHCGCIEVSLIKKTPKIMLSPQCITLPNNPILKNPRHQNKKYEIKIKNIFFTVKTSI